MEDNLDHVHLAYVYMTKGWVDLDEPGGKGSHVLDGCTRGFVKICMKFYHTCNIKCIQCGYWVYVWMLWLPKFDPKLKSS